jgi:tetratricopeptide (TPR) repeat protein
VGIQPAWFIPKAQNYNLFNRGQLGAATGAINYYYHAMMLFDQTPECLTLYLRRSLTASLRALMLSGLLAFASAATAQLELEPGNEIEGTDTPASSDEQGQAVSAQEPTEAEKAAARARAAEISRQLSLRVEAIEILQSEQGIYGPQLQEVYSDLAGFYLEIEDYENAIKLYNDALQVARINTGLYSQAQLPIIRALVENQSLVKAWGEVDQLHELEYFVASRAFELGDENYLVAVERYGQWKLRIVKENILDQSSSGVFESATALSNFYGLALDKLENKANTKPESLLTIISDKTETDLVLARAIARTPASLFNGNASRYTTESRCQNRVNSQGQVVRQCVNVQVENPRYRQSQRDAKNMAVRRYTRQVELSVERLREIRNTSTSLSEAEKLNLDSQIATLETEAIQMQRSERRLFGF